MLSTVVTCGQHDHALIMMRHGHKLGSPGGARFGGSTAGLRLGRKLGRKLGPPSLPSAQFCC